MHAWPLSIQLYTKNYKKTYSTQISQNNDPKPLEIENPKLRKVGLQVADMPLHIRENDSTRASCVTCKISQTQVGELFVLFFELLKLQTQSNKPNSQAQKYDYHQIYNRDLADWRSESADFVKPVWRTTIV